MIIDPGARRVDGESVRIAKDVLCARATTKICLPDGLDEVTRALARRGGRRPVVVGDDRALLRVVTLLHRERTLATTPLAMVPVGPPAAVALASALGIPTDAVHAARTVIDGLDHRLDLLVDDSDGVVIGELSVPYGAAGAHPVDAAGPPGPARAGETAWPAGPAHPGASGADAGPATGPGAAQAPELAPDRAAGDAAPGAGRATDTGDDARGVTDDGRVPRQRQGREPVADRPQPWWSPAARTARTALTLLTTPVAGRTGAGGPPARRARPPLVRLRVEADGVLLADLDHPVERVSVATRPLFGDAPARPPDGTARPRGLAEVVVYGHASGGPVRLGARAITVSGPDFHYRADTVTAGPVRTRTWRLLPDAWSVTLPG
ncbi:hypothetical protein OYE22_14555 [Streptomyces sp. 71268]|uniref:hypothetical protein n=1 Tax=Streptomyces sp. 71268 TaxID=3002640 RepID=UPI0023F79244|nr:hypothetical protein [Streptomyces sp. 71268]WEV29767.1 hypothetical protein OYE22_14555 [Streptomyces sp. 71268]